MLLQRFLRDRCGGVAPIFALAIIPVIGLVGVAIDYSRAASARTAMQAALDATALYLSKEAATSNPEQLKQKAQAYFNATYNHAEAKNVTVDAVYASTSTGFNIKVTGAAAVDTTIARVIGHNSIDIGSSSEVVWGIKKLELALALDNTGSMDKLNKMTELKKAAKDLITTLQAAAKKPDDIKISIIPFATDVNIGTSNVDAAWLDWTDWESPPPNSMPGSDVGPGSQCPYGDKRCTIGPANGSEATDWIPSSGTYKGYICPRDKNGRYYNGCYNSMSQETVCTGGSCSCSGISNCSCSGSGNSKVCKKTVAPTSPPYTHTWIPNARSTWNGCVWDREQDNDVKDTTPTSSTNTMFQPHQATNCPVSTLPLTNNWTALTSKVDAMLPIGNTNVTIGLAWGWHSLTSNVPMTEAAEPSNDLDKVIILLTDGKNTQNRWSDNESNIDVRTKKACENVKAVKKPNGESVFKIYTIRVIEGNASLLRECATNPSMYYEVQTASELSGVFSQITKSLANLRLAK